MTSGRVIDVHSHIYPRRYLDMLKTRGEPPCVLEEGGREYLLLFEEQRGAPPGAGLPLGPAFTELGEKLRFMDVHGISQTVVSVGNPWLDPFVSDDSGSMARAINEELATYKSTTGGRIVGMGVLPAASVELTLRAAEEVAETPGLHGVVTGCRIAGLRFDEPALEPLWSTLAERGVPVLVHPHYSAGRDDLGGFGPALPVSIGNPFETTIALTRLVLAGVVDRHPDLRVIGSHGGGTLPYLAARADAVWRTNSAVQQRIGHPPSEDMAKLILDTVVFDRRPLRAAADLVGPSRIVFGTDHPFAIADAAGTLAAVRVTFENDQREEVLWRSAAEIFRLDSPGGMSA